MREFLVDIDWREVFVPDIALLEIVLRGTIVYLVLFALLRLVLKRESGAVGITDLLVVVLLADAAQNAMGSDYQSIPAGLLLVATIVFWAYALDWLGFRFPQVRRFVHPHPLLLIQDGRIVQENLRRELVTEDELRSQLRLRGIEDPSQVTRAYMESDGRISAVDRDGQATAEAPERQAY